MSQEWRKPSADDLFYSATNEENPDYGTQLQSSADGTHLGHDKQLWRLPSTMV